MTETMDETAQKTDTVTLTIDGREVTVPKGTNIIDAADTVGIEVPHFCYHPELSIAGNCRMCLVEIEGPRGKALVIACNTQVGDGMKVETASEKALAARMGVMEFLLLNHPTDCPICDQVGECRLHEYYMKYDLKPSRMKLEKVHKGKRIIAGPALVHDQERCICCARCVRFTAEITKTFDTSIEYRGDHSKLCVPPGHEITHDYSECLADVCPVGAWTSGKFRFKKRVYFLQSAESICPGCARGCNVLAQFDPLENRLYRLKPRFNPEVNGHWLCDTGRWSFENIQAEERLASPAADGGKQAIEWEGAVNLAAKGLAGFRAAGKCFVIGSPALSNEDVYMLVRLGQAAEAGEFAHHPKPGDSDWDKLEDELLIRREKSPNARGAELLGLGEADYGKTLASVSDDLKDGIFEGGIIVGCDPASLDHEIEDALGRLKFLLVVDTTLTKTGKLATVLLPMATCFERAGTYVNGDGRLQQFEAAVASPAQACAPFGIFGAILETMGRADKESRAASLMAEILKAMGMEPPEDTEEPEPVEWTASGVFDLIRSEVSAFASVADEELGAFGVPMDLS